MRDKRQAWSADFDFVSRNNLSGEVDIRVTLTAGPRYRDTPEPHRGRRVIVAMNQNEVNQLAAILAKHATVEPCTPQS